VRQEGPQGGALPDDVGEVPGFIGGFELEVGVVDRFPGAGYGAVVFAPCFL
jgi:hypothetical protein